MFSFIMNPFKRLNCEWSVFASFQPPMNQSESFIYSKYNLLTELRDRKTLVLAELLATLVASLI